MEMEIESGVVGQIAENCPSSDILSGRGSENRWMWTF
jgi:hypothetical protein